MARTLYRFIIAGKMMRTDVLEFEQFYQSPLGQFAQRSIGAQLVKLSGQARTSCPAPGIGPEKNDMREPGTGTAGPDPAKLNRPGDGLRLAGFGYCDPYLGLFDAAQMRLSIAPAAMGVSVDGPAWSYDPDPSLAQETKREKNNEPVAWHPEAGSADGSHPSARENDRRKQGGRAVNRIHETLNRSVAPVCRVIAADTCWPLPDASIDRVLVIHGLEETPLAHSLLREIWRVLTDDGRLVLVTTNRRSLWAMKEQTPLAAGRPYLRGQLKELLHTSLFTPVAWENALFAPPFENGVTRRAAPLLEAAGRVLWPAFPAVTLVEAQKLLALPIKGHPASAARVLRPLPPSTVPSRAGAERAEHSAACRMSPGRGYR